jgi:hypothetical protein
VITHVLRYVIKDHNGQEAAFLQLEQHAVPESAYRSNIGGKKSIGLKKTLIVRPASLMEGKATGKYVTFDGRKKTPNLNVDRADVALCSVVPRGRDFSKCRAKRMPPPPQKYVRYVSTAGLGIC